MSTARCVDCQRWPAAVGGRCATCDERARRDTHARRCVACGGTPAVARGLCKRCYMRHYQARTLEQFPHRQGPGLRTVPPSRHCEGCGVTFPISYPSDPRRFCSRACYTQARHFLSQPTQLLHDAARVPHEHPQAGDDTWRAGFVKAAIARRWAEERARVAAYEARRTAEWLAAHAKDEPT